MASSLADTSGRVKKSLLIQFVAEVDEDGNCNAEMAAGDMESSDEERWAMGKIGKEDEKWVR